MAKVVSAEMETVLERAQKPISWTDVTSRNGRHNEYLVTAGNRCLQAGLLESVEGIAFDGYGGVVITEKGKYALKDGVY